MIFLTELALYFSLKLWSLVTYLSICRKTHSKILPKENKSNCPKIND